MIYKRYYSPFEEKPSVKRQAEPIPHTNKEPVKKKNVPKTGNSFDIFKKFGSDDFIILGILIILLSEDKENRDIPLILALGFLFIVQYIEAE